MTEETESTTEDRYCSKCGNLLNPGESDPCDWCQASDD